MENNESMEIIDVQTVSVTEAQSRAEIDIQISTAKRFPRNAVRAVDNVIALVTKDKDLAKSCVYSLPRAGKDITGASVHLARLLASEYKNLRVMSRIVDIGETMITAQSVCLDLENNNAVSTEVKRRITGKNGQRFAEDMIVMTCNAALAIASRNAILQVIPTWFVQRVFRSAQQAIIGDISTEQLLLRRRKEVLDGFLTNYNVTEAEILALLELETVNQIKETQILTLVGLANAINDGDTTVHEAFNRNKDKVASDTKAKVSEAIQKANEKLRAKRKPEPPREEPPSNVEPGKLL